MRKFKFNLQRVLDYRESIEEKLLMELAAVRARHDREVAKLAEISRHRDRFRRRMKESASGGRADADEIRRAHLYMDDLVRQIRAQQVAVTEAEEARQRKTTEVVEAAKDRKVLERLRDYRLVEHTSETRALEQKFLDDVSSIRSNRTRSVRRPGFGGVS